MFGATRGDNPGTGASWDDTKRYVDKAARSEDDLRKIYELNARRVYPRLDPRLGLAKRNHFWSSIAANCRQGSGQ
jgi:4-oxalmesaconate hydratase